MSAEDKALRNETGLVLVWSDVAVPRTLNRTFKVRALAMDGRVSMWPWDGERGPSPRR